jgi:hypothetical protein
MSRPRAFGSASTLATSALICMTSARGVPAGANSPERLVVRQAGRRWSGGRVVGWSGNNPHRRASVVAITRRLPAAICGIATIGGPNSI